MRLPTILGLFAALTLAATAQADSKPTDFKSSDGRYVLKAPGKSRQDKKQLAAGATGLAIPVVTDRWEGASSTVLAVTVATYPDSFREVPAKTILDGVRDGLKGTDGKVVDEQMVVLGKDEDKVEGREFRIEAGSKNSVRVRVFLVETRLYQVMVTGNRDTVMGKPATEFLDSFKLVK